MNWNKSVTIKALGVTLALMFNQVHATPISGEMSLDATAGSGATLVSDPQHVKSQWALTNLSIASVSSVGGVVVNGAGKATWTADGNSGSVQLTRSWTLPASGGLANFDNLPISYSYSFWADQDGQFKLNYDIAASGDPFGMFGWDIFWNGPGGGQTLSDVRDPTARGVFTRNVAAGEQYNFGLVSWSNIGSSGATTASMTGNFDFVISADNGNAVPEPGSLALAGLAFVGVMVARRRRTSVVQA